MTSRAAYINTELAVIAAEGSYITTNVAVHYYNAQTNQQNPKWMLFGADVSGTLLIVTKFEATDYILTYFNRC
jgi:hypothetical protein